MKVILLQDVKGQGKAKDIITVSDSYALNFLLPKKLAVLASATAIRQKIEHETAQVRKLERAVREEEKLVSLLNGKSITFTTPASEQGALYASITDKDVVSEINTQFKVQIDKKQISMDPIKSVGAHEVAITTKSGASATLMVYTKAAKKK